ncbi:hypothetical protein [Curtobacterium sp. RRHDQ10]|uniref:hypothetical protein n=1 Tax=Curtobacterium phyllosphaerae TaxID=3413379 RepID=UPI003BEFB553
MTNTTLDLTHVDGTVASIPVLTHEDLVEFVVIEGLHHEYLVRLPRTDLGAHVRLGDHVLVAGAEGWVVPGRAWFGEPSRTILQAHEVRLAEYAVAA